MRVRTYGDTGPDVVLVHGGPGATGTMAPVARELADRHHVIEPLFQAHSVDGQVQELEATIEAHARDPRAAIVGHSWGAMLALLHAARHPARVDRVVLVGSGVYDETAVLEIRRARDERLGPEGQETLRRLEGHLRDGDPEEAAPLLESVAALFLRADTFDPLTTDLEGDTVDAELHTTVWKEAIRLRAAGAFLEAAAEIDVPVIGIHGDHDPHPAHAVRDPLAEVTKDFTFHVLPRCGHYPWIERHARDAFFDLLREAVATDRP
ncbi:MAG: alpha/beta fold hydrolase [Planctomycetota bacterium]|jgi:pimeloyl-ACP methyl ester carboxylesterase